MFCPKCGLEEKQDGQFCRSCGADLNRVRGLVALNDQAATDPKAEISKVIAAKIGWMESASELKTVAEDVLPELEKFLEGPAERRLRRMRVGTLLSCIGLGAAFACFLIALTSDDASIFAGCGAGIVTFFIGVAFVLNGVFLTVPKGLTGSTGAGEPAQIRSDTTDLRLPPPGTSFSSVTEGTTRHLEQVRLAKTDDR